MSEVDDEITAIVTDPKTKSDTFGKKPIVLYHFDSHATKLLRDTYNTNLKLLVFAAFFNILYLVMYYTQGWTWYFVLWTGFIPVVWNMIIHTLVREEIRVRWAMHTLGFVVTGVVYLVVALCYIGLMVFFFWTTFDINLKKQGYEQVNMWVFTSILLCLMSTINALHSVLFIRYYYCLRVHNMKQAKSLNA